MNIVKSDVVFQEVPDEISVAFMVAGCKIGCKGCHSSACWEDRGTELTEQMFRNTLKKYSRAATCVLFLGGEWCDELPLYLDIARESGYKTCLYTGRESVPEYIRERLTFLKTGPWKENLGGLSSPTTNQQFVEVRTGKNLNYKFIRN